jgi:hypothetical protein
VPLGKTAPCGLLRADDGVRTRDPQLGKLMLYQLSYVRVRVILAGDARPLGPAHNAANTASGPPRDGGSGW